MTPAFYSRFVHYAYTSEAFDRECTFTDEMNRTCWISRPELLVQLLEQSASTASQRSCQRGRFSEAKWLLLKKLRCAPADPAYNVTPKSSEFRLEDVRTVKYSEMDSFVKTQRPQLAGEYRRTVTKLFLAQRFCMGFPQVITLTDWILRVSLCYFAAKAVLNSDIHDRNVFLEQDWWGLPRIIAAATISHAFGLLKGYR